MLLELECGFLGVGFFLRTEVYSDAVAVKISADSLRYRAAAIVETSDDKLGLIHDKVATSTGNRPLSKT
jgi:hypothetical protein